jgi:hypothetical protein
MRNPLVVGPALIAGGRPSLLADFMVRRQVSAGKSQCRSAVKENVTETQSVTGCGTNAKKVAESGNQAPVLRVDGKGFRTSEWGCRN